MPGLRRRNTSMIALALSVCTLPTVAAAEPRPHPRPEDATRADALFEQGKTEMAAGRHAAACAAFSESYALDPSEGTLLALGLCHEQEGKLVRAFAELRDVHASAARSDRADRQRVARAALARVAPQIARVVVHGPEPGSCEAIRIDAEVLPTTELDLEVPVDPGEHRVTCERTATSPTTVVVSVRRGALRVIDLTPASVPLPEPRPLGIETNGNRQDTRGDSRRTVGWLFGGAGILALGAGAFLGLRAFDQWSDVRAKCEPRACEDPSAVSDVSSARGTALASDITFVAGIALVVISGYLLLTPSRTPAASRGIR